MKILTSSHDSKAFDCVASKSKIKLYGIIPPIASILIMVAPTKIKNIKTTNFFGLSLNSLMDKWIDYSRKSVFDKKLSNSISLISKSAPLNIKKIETPSLRVQKMQRCQNARCDGRLLIA